jgi:hypothetical protein
VFVDSRDDERLHLEQSQAEGEVLEAVLFSLLGLALGRFNC